MNLNNAVSVKDALDAVRASMKSSSVSKNAKFILLDLQVSLAQWLAYLYQCDIKTRQTEIDTNVKEMEILQAERNAIKEALSKI